MVRLDITVSSYGCETLAHCGLTGQCVNYMWGVVHIGCGVDKTYR